jgi:formylglycine-generating enzyme required for sulfatase activity
VTPATASKDAPFVNSLGMKFVPVPITGGPTGGQRVLFSVWETRVQDYAAFARETKLAEIRRKPNYPAMMVNWEEATAFCNWLTDLERKAGKLGANEGYRLPSDHEWSCAVGIGAQEDAAQTPAEKGEKLAEIFPWGSAWPPPAGAGNFAGEEVRADVGTELGPKGFVESYTDAFADASPVGSFPANSLGLYDLDGNVREMCGDWIDGAKRYRVARGGSWTDSDRADLRSSRRVSATPTGRTRALGFRVVLAPVAPTPLPRP